MDKQREYKVTVCFTNEKADFRPLAKMLVEYSRKQLEKQEKQK